MYSFCRWPTLKPKQMREYSTDLVQKGSVWRVKLIIEVKKITIYFFCVWMRSMIYLMFQLLEKVIFIFYLESIVRLIDRICFWMFLEVIKHISISKFWYMTPKYIHCLKCKIYQWIKMVLCNRNISISRIKNHDYLRVISIIYVIGIKKTA